MTQEGGVGAHIVNTKRGCGGALGTGGWRDYPQLQYIGFYQEDGERLGNVRQLLGYSNKSTLA